MIIAELSDFHCFFHLNNVSLRLNKDRKILPPPPPPSQQLSYFNILLFKMRKIHVCVFVRLSVSCAQLSSELILIIL